LLLNTAQHSDTINLTKTNLAFNVRPTELMVVPPSVALETDKRLIGELQSTMDMVLLPEVCTKCPTFFRRELGVESAKSRKDDLSLPWLLASPSLVRC
jgi:hypothetical protein